MLQDIYRHTVQTLRLQPDHPLCVQVCLSSLSYYSACTRHQTSQQLNYFPRVSMESL